MAAIALVKAKRKDLGNVYGDFSDFTSSSPARKIRRLDAELPPIIEEEEEDPGVRLVFEQQVWTEQMSYSMPMADAEPGISLNEESALVLYNPSDGTLVLPSSARFTVSSHILSGLKDKAFWPRNPNLGTIKNEPMAEKHASYDGSLALVPWHAPVAAHKAGEAEWKGGLEDNAMDAEAGGVESMEVEEEIQGDAATAGVGGGDSFHQWPQHCVTPQFPPNASTHIMWSWG